MTEREKPGYLKRIVEATTIGGAVMLAQCSRGPEPIPLADTPITFTAKVPSSDPVQNYKDAYHVFEQSVDEALVEAQEQKKALTSQALKILANGIDFIFRPTSASGRPGACYLVSKAAPGKHVCDFPKVVAMFDAYAKLCKAQNAVMPEQAIEQGLKDVPKPETISKFIDKRRLLQPDDTRLSDGGFKLIEGWIAKPFAAACDYAQVRCEFGFSGDHHNNLVHLKKAITDASLAQVRPETYTIQLTATNEKQEFNIPSIAGLLELKRSFPKNSLGHDLAEEMLKLRTQPARIFRHSIVLLKVTEFPVDIRMEDPSPQQTAEVSRGR